MSARWNLWGGLCLAAAVLAAASGLAVFYWLAPAQAMSRMQPIAFSHRLHVTDKGIDCYYCHSYPERSLNAGLPPAETCLGCHRHIIPEHPEIRKLRGFAAAAEPIPWVRVFYCPDHTFFPHYRHIGKGVACTECHGAVPARDRLGTHTFYMGMCISCHEQRGASRECTACHG